MSRLSFLPEKWRKLLPELAKFGTVGGINTVVNYAVFNALILTLFKDGQLKANIVATVVATTTSYLMNRHWTYRDRPKSALRREYVLFFLFNGVGLVIEVGVLGLVKYGLGYESLLALNIAKTAGLVLGTVFRFWSYRTFVFKLGPAPTEIAVTDTAAAAARADAEASSLPHTTGPAASTGGPAASGAPGDDETFAALARPIEAELRTHEPARSEGRRR